MHEGERPLTTHTRSAPHALRVWARIADALTLVLLGIALSIAFFGGFRVAVPGAVLTAHSTLRALALAALVCTVRHALVPRNPLHLRLVKSLQSIRASEAVRVAAPAFLWSRVGILLTAYFAVIAFGYPVEQGVRMDRVFRVSEHEVINLPARWDAGWYVGIAREGYEYESRTGQQNVAFFPAFPLATRIAGVFVGAHVDRARAARVNRIRLLWAGVLVNLASLAAALYYLHRMVVPFAGEPAAALAVHIALAWPFAFIFNAAYSEGLFLLASIATFYYFGRSRPIAAAWWGALAGLTRPSGFLLTLPLLAIALARAGLLRRIPMDRLSPAGDERQNLVRDCAAAVAPLAGALAFSAYLYAMWGDPLLWTRVHASWGRSYQGLGAAADPFLHMLEWGLYAYTSVAGVQVLHVLLFAIAIGVSIPIAWRLGAAYTLLIVLTLLPPLLAGGWLSMGRFTVVLFPVYVYLAVALPVSQRVPLIVVLSMLQGLGAALFFTWRPYY